MMERTVHLQVDEANTRLDRYLAQQLPNLSRAQVQRLIRTGLVSVNGRPAKPSALVTPGAWVRVCIPVTSARVPEPEPIDLNIVYEDEDLVVINKPAGLIVHPGAGRTRGTLVDALLARYPDLRAGESERPGIVHRLDRDTSGLLVIARTEQALRDLQRQFKSRRVQKTYLALVHGRPPAAQGIIEAALGRDVRHRQRIAVMPGGRPARTRYQVLAELGDYSLLSVWPETGRTHQIRVHLAWLGVPIVGDQVYGRRDPRLGLKRQFLHAWRLAFDRPGDRGRLGLEAPLPDDLQQVLQQLGVVTWSACDPASVPNAR